jgi:two-component system sensor histidine kinase KdpD
LQQANIELARLADTERQIRALEETDRVRREFLANVSHELRTPMGSILTGTTTLLRRPSLADDLRGEVEALAREARRLDRLVSDLLEMTRIEGGIIELHPAEVDLTEAVTAAVDRLHRQSPGRPVAIEVPPATPEVMADWSRLGQVLDNLLENADHAAPSGSPIRVTAAPGDDGMLVVRVIDAGPGVPAAMRAQIFDRFVRGGQTNSPRAAGMGLGLPIVRGLVQVQGGTVWLEDPASGQGACFAFSLPSAGVPDAGSDS